MRYFSLFTGIGGFELGIQQAYEEKNQLVETTTNKDSQSSKQSIKGRRGVRKYATCVGFSEIDKYAIQIFKKHYPTIKNYGDCTKINVSELPEFEMLVGGFPCQSFSIAGKRGGFKDTRGTLFFEIARIAKAKRPRLLFLENVKGLLSHNEGNTFATIISTIDELGYDCQWQVLNSKNFGVPQNRERVFIIGHLRGTSRPKVFPITGTSQENNGLEIRAIEKMSKSNERNVVYDKEGISPTLNTAQGGGLTPLISSTIDANYHKGNSPSHRKNKRLRTEIWQNSKGLYTFPVNTKKGYAEAKEGNGINLSFPKSKTRRGRIIKENSPTLQASGIGSIGTIQDTKIRRLTPTECERLQGFPDGWTEGVSDTQRYKTLGNAVTVNVIKAIAQRLWT